MGKQIPVFGVEMTGFGQKLPRECYSNQRLIKDFGIDSDPEWIYDHTGIRYRHIAGDGENVVTLGTESALRALRDAGKKTPQTIDYMLVASSSADTYRPISGAHPGIHGNLWEKGYQITAAHDLNLACTGLIKALEEGYKRFTTDGDELVLVIGTEQLSKRVGFHRRKKLDKGTSIVFGDASGAIVLESTGSESGIHGWWHETDGRQEKFLYADDGKPIYMDGPAVLRKAVRVMVRIGDLALQKAEENTDFKRDNIDWVVPHQANIRIIAPANEKLGFKPEQLIVDLDKHGNTSTASIPMALMRGIREGKIKKGDNLLMPSFGGGFGYEAMVITF